MNTKLPDLNLQVGDEVEAFGVKGVVANIAAIGTYPITVAIEGEGSYGFTADGRFYTWSKTPSLKLIKRKPKTVEKTVELKRYLLQDKDDPHRIHWSVWGTIEALDFYQRHSDYKILKTETMTETYTEEVGE